jgi:geranylgeranyl diphosphate synthase, type II
LNKETQNTKRVSRRRKTSHLKLVPDSKPFREEMRAKCRALVSTLDRSRPMSKDEMESISRRLLEENGLPEGFLGWAMVILSSCFWEEQIQSIPYNRRLFLLPHCLKHAEGCPADYDEFGLACKKCGACSIADFRSTAEDLGYKVLVAEGSPIVLKIIVSGHIDAIMGVACLNVLEKAIDKILLAGIPCMAVPLLSSDCRNTSVDEDWVDQMVRVPHRDMARKTRTYVNLMRAASNMFEEEQFAILCPSARADSAATNLKTIDPVAATEAIAFDFLRRGGKQSRPFMLLSVYDALTGGHGTLPGGGSDLKISDSVKRTAISIETFHKASLVHDDIQDSDDFRYGQPAIHKQHGIPLGINIGDYLIGLGYRLVSRDRQFLGAEKAADILDFLADAHQRLCEGQGAELVWRDREDKRIKPIDALKIYALKTAPAFEAALYCGARLADQGEKYAMAFKSFARNLGVAFQILNDLKDWETDDLNKKTLGADLLNGRPTVLWALALEGLQPALKEELVSLTRPSNMTAEARIQRARQLYIEAGVFDLANQLIDKHQSRAEEVADEIDCEDLRRLLYYIVDNVLDRSPEVRPTIEINHLSYAETLPIVAGR